jgi:hypothetical protein
VSKGRVTPKGTKNYPKARHAKTVRAVTMVRAKDGIHMIGPKRPDVVLGDTHISMTSGQAAMLRRLGAGGLMADTQTALIDAMAQEQRA